MDDGEASPVLKKPAIGPLPPAAPARVRGAPKAQRERYGKSDLVGTDSLYLCLFCYEPLYVDAAAGAMKELCLNRNCIDYACNGAIAGDIEKYDGPRRAEKLCRASIRKFRRFSRGFLFQKIHEARAAECAGLFRKTGMNISIVASLDYLMTQLCGTAARGASRDHHDCRAAFKKYYKNFEMRQLTEDLCSKNYITNARSQPFVAKYHLAIKEFLKAYGIVGGDDRQNRPNPLPFYHIDRRSMGLPAESALDFESIYKNSLSIAIALNHVFKSHRFMSKIHGYPARPEDLAALRSLWETRLSGPAGTIAADGLREIYEAAARESGMGGNFDRFLADYTSGKTYAPILIFDGKAYRYDYSSLLLYLIYLHSNSGSRADMRAEAGRTIHDRNRQSAAAYFEAEIRQKLRGDGFDVRPERGGKPFRPSFGGERREFDCVAVDRERRIIVIVEAKYEDMAPSSMAATSMVDQMVLDKKRGLLAHAKNHHARREFFKRHFRDLGRHGLDLPGCFLDYDLHALLVTKHEPLISRHMGVGILSYREFMSGSFRPPAVRPAGGREDGGPARPAPARGAGTARPRHGAKRGRHA